MARPSINSEKMNNRRQFIMLGHALMPVAKMLTMLGIVKGVSQALPVYKRLGMRGLPVAKKLFEASKAVTPKTYALAGGSASVPVLVNALSRKHGKEVRSRYGLDKQASLRSHDGTNAAILSHELGHARQLLDKSGKSKRWKEGIRSAAPVAGTAGLLYSIFKRKPALGALSVLGMGAPVLYEEGAASVRGVRGLKRLGLSKDELSTARKTLAPAFGTYAAGYGIPAALTYSALKHGIGGGLLHSLLLTTGTTAGLMALAKHYGKKGVRLSDSGVEKLKNEIGAHKNVRHVKGKGSPLQAYFVPPSANRSNKDLGEVEAQLFHTVKKDKDQYANLKGLLQHGGVNVPDKWRD